MPAFATSTDGQTAQIATYPEQTTDSHHRPLIQKDRPEWPRRPAGTPSTNRQKEGRPNTIEPPKESTCLQSGRPLQNGYGCLVRDHFFDRETEIRRSLKLKLNSTIRRKIGLNSNSPFTARIHLKAPRPPAIGIPRAAKNAPNFLRVLRTHWGQKGVLGGDTHRANCDRIT